jgi:hypothetical protein
MMLSGIARWLVATVDELEPKSQNQDSPHQYVKVGEQPRSLTPKMSSLLHLYLHSYPLYRFLIDAQRCVYI